MISPPANPPSIQAALATERTWLSMGTRLSATLEVERGSLIAAQEAVFAEASRVEAFGSTWRSDTPWSRLNDAKGAAIPLDRESLELLSQCQAWGQRTEGAFDPVLAALIRIYGLRGARALPDPEVLQRARAASGSRLLSLDLEKGTARLLDPAAGLEEGGFLKGYALDKARTAARQLAAHSGLLDFGGQLLAWGTPRRVFIADSRDRQSERLVLWLRDASLSTSGCAERGRHILDPRSGELCPDWGSVSVVMPSGLDADVLSTALYVMGPDLGLAWADRHRIPALFLPHGQAPRASEAFTALHPQTLH